LGWVIVCSVQQMPSLPRPLIFMPPHRIIEAARIALYYFLIKSVAKIAKDFVLSLSRRNEA